MYLTEFRDQGWLNNATTITWKEQVVIISIALLVQSYFYHQLDEELNDVRSLVMQLHNRLDSVHAVQSNHSAALESMSGGFDDMQSSLTELSKASGIHNRDVMKSGCKKLQQEHAISENSNSPR